MKKKTVKLLGFGVLGLAGLVGWAYALQITKPDWAEKIGATKLLELLKLIPPSGGIKITPAEVESQEAPVVQPGGKQTVGGRQYGKENGGGKPSGGVGAGVADLPPLDYQIAVPGGRLRPVRVSSTPSPSIYGY